MTRLHRLFHFWSHFESVCWLTYVYDCCAIAGTVAPSSLMLFPPVRRGCKNSQYVFVLFLFFFGGAQG